MSDDNSTDVEANSTEKKEIEEFLNVDNFLQEVVGANGWWQWIITLYLMLSTPSPATFPVYANSAPPFRCRMEPQIENFITQHNLTFSQVAERIGPWSSSTITQNLSSPSIYGCSRYQLDWNTVNLDEVFAPNPPPFLPAPMMEKCPQGHVYENSPDHYPGNVVKEFDTVCDNSPLMAFGTSMYMVGMLIGFLIGGWCGDHFGRRITLTFFSCLEVAATIGVSLAPNYAVYVLFRTIIGIGNTVKVAIGNVLVYEITLAKYRSIFGAVLALGLDFLFRAYMALCAYLIPYWRPLNAAVMCTGALGLFYPFVLPESPRWLLSRRQLRKAVNELHRGCQINQMRKVVLDEGVFHQYREKAGLLEEQMKPIKAKCNCHCKGCTNGLWLKLFKSRSLVGLTALSSFVVFGITLCFFGLLLYARILIGSIYMHGFLSSLTGIPATLASALVYRYVSSRNRPLIAVLSLAGVFLTISLLNSFVQTKPIDLVLTITSNCGLILITTSVCMIYVYIAELYPSEIRTYGFGVVFAISRIGPIICPFVNELDHKLAHGSPMIIYSAVLMLVLWALSQLPDTHGVNLADFTEQSSETLSDKTDSQCEMEIKSNENEV